MSDAHDPGFDRLRNIAQADAAEAVTEAENRDAVNWSMHVQAHEANYQQSIAVAALAFQQAALREAAVDLVRVTTIMVAATALKGILRGWKRVL